MSPSSPARAPSAPARNATVEILGPLAPGYVSILTPEALDFVAGLDRLVRDRRRALLARRIRLQGDLDRGFRPRFLPGTREIRRGQWRIAPVPEQLWDRRVEITGPPDRKMIINALNSGANVFMADFEDACSPTWANLIEGQAHLRDAVRRTIAWKNEETGREYRLAEKTAALMVRPRGWHLEEKHVQVDGRPVSASVFDFALYFFHNAHELIRRGAGPWFYLPKVENHLEARLWNDVFLGAQHALGIPRGTIKATVLIETILAAFEMDEILWELREHSAGLNCGRWDYIFSFIKKFRNDRAMVLPDRGTVGMTQPFMNAYSRLLIKTCHRRGAHAMGGMAAQIPIKNDRQKNDAALAKVRADKRREALAGHDGTWVAHPGLVAGAKTEFDAAMPGPNQIHRRFDDLVITEEALLDPPQGPITESGLRQNLTVGVLYLEAWLRGQGCVPLFDLMEDAATAEISRSQIWQWLRHSARLDDGRIIDRTLILALLHEEMASARARVGETTWNICRFEESRELFQQLTLADEFADFLTLPAYDRIVTFSPPRKPFA
jgi:malate synthase